MRVRINCSTSLLKTINGIAVVFLILRRERAVSAGASPMWASQVNIPTVRISPTREDFPGIKAGSFPSASSNCKVSTPCHFEIFLDGGGRRPGFSHSASCVVSSYTSFLPKVRSRRNVSRIDVASTPRLTCTRRSNVIDSVGTSLFTRVDCCQQLGLDSVLTR